MTSVKYGAGRKIAGATTQNNHFHLQRGSRIASWKLVSSCFHGSLPPIPCIPLYIRLYKYIDMEVAEAREPYRLHSRAFRVHGVAASELEKQGGNVEYMECWLISVP